MLRLAPYKQFLYYFFCFYILFFSDLAIKSSISEYLARILSLLLIMIVLGIKNLQTAISNVEVIPYIPSSHHFYKLEFVDSIYIVSISISHPNTSSNRIEMDPSLQNSLTE